MHALVEILALPADDRRRLGLTHTPAEIHRQPEAWRQTARTVRQHAAELAGFLAAVRQLPAPRLVFSGAGTSHFAGLSLAGLFQRTGLAAAAVAATETAIDPAEALPPGPFGLVSVSRSGNSPEGSQAFRLVARRHPAAPHLVITCNPDGELYRLAGTHPGAMRLLLPPETNDQGLAMTCSYTSMVVAAQGLAGLTDLAGYERQVEEQAAGAARILDTYAAPLAELAARRPGRVLFLGTGTLLGAACEGYLKVQELTAGQVIGKAESFLGLRHGPMAAIDPNTLVVAFVSSDPGRRRYETDLLRDLRAKGLGAATVAVAVQAGGLDGLADLLVEPAPGAAAVLPDDLRPPVDVVVAQLLGLFLSLAAGLTPDDPAGGVINRVVQGVQIYDDADETNLA